ncbi:hypothetical protein C8Q79DRAFT_487003 [Trametes meyenii]|nr:hypothetical protein C8Q79DRAFT_487003 [Trametes meyenii]
MKLSRHIGMKGFNLLRIRLADRVQKAATTWAPIAIELLSVSTLSVPNATCGADHFLYDRCWVFTFCTEGAHCTRRCSSGLQCIRSRCVEQTDLVLPGQPISDPFLQTFFSAKPCDTLLAALEQLQGALPPTGFAVEEWSIADAAVTPFLARLFLYLEVGLGKYEKEDGEKMRAALAGERFARLKRYNEDARQRSSFKKAWGSDASQVEMGRNIPAFLSG